MFDWGGGQHTVPLPLDLGHRICTRVDNQGYDENDSQFLSVRWIISVFHYTCQLMAPAELAT